MALGHYVSFSGIVTFKRSTDLRALATSIPLERLLIETDAPNLAPVRPLHARVELVNGIAAVHLRGTHCLCRLVVWLHQEPFRGKVNEPRLVVHVAAAVAGLRGMTTQALLDATTANFFRLFTKVPRDLAPPSVAALLTSS